MQHKILITNNCDGNHAPDTWAMAAAETLADTTNLDGSKHLEAQRMVLKFADVLVKHFADTQAIEQSRLQHDPEYVTSDVPDQVDGDLDEMVDEIEQAAAGTPWQDHYALTSVRMAVRDQIKHFLCNSMHVDRLTYVRRNPNNEFAQAYRARYGV